MIRVLLADDRTLVREGLQLLIETDSEFTVVGTACDGEEAVRKAVECRPDIVLMDLMDLVTPGIDGVEATRLIKSRVPGVPVLVVTGLFDGDNVRSALDSGAVGYLLKDAQPHDLHEGMRSVLRGESPLDSRAAGVMLRCPRKERLTTDLTEREQEVLRCVASGMANKQIAHLLDIKEGTVKAHLGRIYQRIGVVERTSAAAWARSHLSYLQPQLGSRRDN